MSFRAFRGLKNPRHLVNREPWVLREEADGVLENKLVNGLVGMPAAAHLHSGLRHGERIAATPVARAVQPHALAAVHLIHVDRAGRRGFRLRVKRDARPETRVQHHCDGVLFHMVDDDAPRLDARVGFDRVEDEPRALVLVLEMRRVDEAIRNWQLTAARSTCLINSLFPDVTT